MSRGGLLLGILEGVVVFFSSRRRHTRFQGDGSSDVCSSDLKGPSQPRQPLQTVADVMSHEAVTVSPEAGVNDAWRVLAEHGVAQAPVLDAGGRVVGLLLQIGRASCRERV